MAMHPDSYTGSRTSGADGYADDLPSASYGSAEARSLGQLFAELSADLSDLLHKEVMLAQAEATEKVSNLAKGAGMAVAGGFIAYAGFVVLLIALATLAAQWIEPWMATAAVAALTLVIGLILLMAGRSKLKNTQLKPEETIDSLKENVEWAKEQVR